MSIVDEADRLCSEHGHHFWAKVHEYARSGHVLIGPDYLALAQQVGDEDLFIWLAIGRGALHKLSLMAPTTTKRIHWARSLKGGAGQTVRTYPFERIKTLLQRG